MAGINVIRAGIFTRLQDGGRFAYKAIGVPTSAPMDTLSFKMANLLVGNKENATQLEMVSLGPKLVFKEAATISFTGCNMEIKLNGKIIDLLKSGQFSFAKINLKKNDQLALGTSRYGSYGYLAIEGGFKSEKPLGSQTQFQGITQEPCLKDGDELQFIQNTVPASAEMLEALKLAAARNFDFDQPILAYPSAEFNCLTKAHKEFLSQPLKLSPSSNRMAFTIQTNIPTSNEQVTDMLSSPVAPGVVQLTPSGDLIILMRDCQTTGGYPRVLYLQKNAINQLAQRGHQPVVLKIVES